MGPAPDRRQSRHGQSDRHRARGRPRLDGRALRLLLLGRRGSINHWLEDAAHAFRAAGHEVARAYSRGGSLARAARRLTSGRLEADIARRLARRRFDLVLAIGGFHESGAALRAIQALPGRPPIVAWVGDAFEADAAPLSELYDLVGHTDSALLARHRALGFASPAIFLPHAVDPARRVPRAPRSERMVFIGAASAEREAVVASVGEPLDVRGPGWRRDPASPHHIRAGRIPHAATARLYARALAALNIRNARNVVAGLNQRNFDPYLFGAPVVSDAQPDLERCFETGSEVLIWRDFQDLNDQYARLRREAGLAARIAQAGLKRIHAEHTFEHRLRAILRAL